MAERWESRWQGPQKEGLGTRVVRGAQDAILNWWEHAGPASVENRVVRAHQTILDAMPDGERKDAFRQAADAWRKAGKVAGAAASAIDFSLAGVGLWLSYRGLTNPYPEHITYEVGHAAIRAMYPVDAGINAIRKVSHAGVDTVRRIRRRPYRPGFYPIYPIGSATAHLFNQFFVAADGSVRTSRLRLAGRLFPFIPGIGAAASYAGMGPAHAVAVLSARAVEGAATRSIKRQAKKPR